MHRQIAATLLSLTLLSSLSAAAYAADNDAASTSDKSDKTTAAPAAAAKPAKSSGGDGGSIPSRMASFLVGTIVGTPVSFVRKTKQETVNATKDLVGDTDNKFLIGAAATLGVPAGIVSGAFQAPIYGIWNAWTGSADEPFSEESMSLGDSK